MGSHRILQLGDPVLRKISTPVETPSAAHPLLHELRDTLHEGNGAAWQAALQRPDIALNEEWALCFRGDKISQALAAPMPGKTPYARVYADLSPEGKVVEIWKRTRRP